MQRLIIYIVFTTSVIFLTFNKVSGKSNDLLLNFPFYTPTSFSNPNAFVKERFNSLRINTSVAEFLCLKNNKVKSSTKSSRNNSVSIECDNPKSYVDLNFFYAPIYDSITHKVTGLNYGANIQNKAKGATFSDIVVKVDFVNNKLTPIFTIEFPIDKIFEPDEKYTFNNETIYKIKDSLYKLKYHMYIYIINIKCIE